VSTLPETSIANEARSGWSSYRSVGIEAILAAFDGKKGLKVLDLGLSHASTLNVYSRFASRIQFMDLVTEEETFPVPAERMKEILTRIPSGEFDLIMCWDTLNYFEGGVAAEICGVLGKACASGGKVHILGWNRPQMPSTPLEFILEEDLDVYFNAKSKQHLDSIEWKKAQFPKLFPGTVLERGFLTRAGLEEFILNRSL